MHWGETKTWYGIPGGDAEKFEAAIKKEAPDWFEAQPDLLFQLVTLMNPQRLTDAGVRVYACSPSRLATPWTGLCSEVQGTPQASCLFKRRIARHHHSAITLQPLCGEYNTTFLVIAAIRI